MYSTSIIFYKYVESKFSKMLILYYGKVTVEKMLRCNIFDMPFCSVSMFISWKTFIELLSIKISWIKKNNLLENIANNFLSNNLHMSIF